MEAILEELVKHIGNNMPDMKVVDEDYGQLEALDQENRDMYPLTFPAVLIEAPSVEWSNIGGLSQKGHDTHYTSGTVGKIVEREKIRRRLHELLQGHRIGEDSALIRTSSRFYTFNHGIKVYESTYTLEITEMFEPDLIPVPKPKIVIRH